MKTYTKEEIKTLLSKSNKAVERGILAIYGKQTVVEQVTESTLYGNGIGFSAFDANRGSYYAEWIKKGRHLTGEHIEKGRKIITKYSKQLADIANKKQIEKRNTAKSLLERRK